MALFEYRLVVRNQTDTADLLDVSTRQGGTNPYLEGPPSGDGAEFDPISGASRSGSFSGVVIDPITSGTSRLVTSLLEDTGGRPQFGALKAAWYYAVNGGAWQVLIPGVVSSVRTSGGAFEITVADATLAERKATAFAPKQGETIAAYLARWPIRGCVVGGPVRGGGFLDFPDLGGWEMEAQGHLLNNSTYFKFLAGSAAPEFKRVTDIAGLGGPSNHAAGMGDLSKVVDFYNDGSFISATGYFQYATDTKKGPWPGMIAEVTTAAGVTTYAFPNVAQGLGVLPQDIPRLVQDSGKWKGLVVGALVMPLATRCRIRYFDALPSERSPLYWTGHPVDLLAALWAEAGFSYSATAIETVRGSLGADLRLSLAVTKTEDLSEFLERTIYGPFGISVRANTAGEFEPFTTRVSFGAVPTRTIDDDDVPCAEDGSPEGTAYDLDTGQAITRVTFQCQPLVRDVENPPAADGIARSTTTFEIDSDDPYRIGQKEQSFTLPGIIHRVGQTAGATTMRPWADALAHELFDRFGRGTVTAEIPLLAGYAGDGVVLGEEIYDARPQTPNANKRQGDDPAVNARIGQVVRVTPTATGPVVKVLDSGFWGQAPATAPTHTIAASTDYPQTAAELTITNAATLTAADSHVRVQMAVSAGAPAATAYTDVAYFRSADIPTAEFLLPAVTPGSTVWVRARSEKTGGRPGNWTTPVSVTLTTATAPSALAVTPDGTDGTRATVTWTVGDAASETDVYLRLGSGANVRQVSLSAGSTRFTLTDLTPGSGYTVGVEHRHPATGDLSARVEAAFTAGAAVASLPAPTYPTGFSGAQRRGSPSADGSYGIAVSASLTTGFVEVEEAVETAVGSGVYGSWTTQIAVPVVQGDWTIWKATAPSDGRRRQLMARHVRTGATSSAYTAVVTVSPWTVVALPGYSATVSGPSLDVVATPGPTSYSITHVSSGGTLELSIDGGVYSAAPASPIAVTRPAAGSPAKSYAFRITGGGQSISNEVTVPAIDQDTVTPGLSVTPSTVSTTTVEFTVTASNPAGGAAPDLYVEFIGTSGYNVTTAVSYGVGTYTIASGNVIRVNRPAFDTTAQATVTFTAGITGGGSEVIQRSIANQVKDSFGPTLEVTPTPGSSSYSIAYTYTGTVTLSINGGAYAAPAASPIVVARTSSDQAYTFKCVLDGQTITQEVTVPALAGAGGGPYVGGVFMYDLFAPSDGGGSFDVSWNAVNCPTGTTFDVVWTITAGSYGAPSSGTSTGVVSGVTISAPLNASPSPEANVVVKAQFNGSTIATGATSGLIAI